MGIRYRLTEGADDWWWLLVALVVITGGFIAYSFLGTLMLGLFVYYAARPFARRFERYVDSPTIAGALALVLIALPLVLVVGSLVLIAITQAAELRPETLSTILQYLFPDTDFSGLPADPVEFGRSMLDMIGIDNLQTVLDSLLSVAGLFAALFFNGSLALLFAFYLLRDDRDLTAWFHENIAAEGTTIDRYLEAVDEDLHNVFFGTIITIFVVIILSAVVYLALNLVAPPELAIPQPILLAVITGLATLIPMVGRALVYLAVAGWMGVIIATSAASAIWFPIVFVLVMILVVDSIINYGVQPYFTGKSLHTGLMLFAITLGTVVFGWYGIFFGPVLLVINADFLQHVLPELVDSSASADSPPPSRPSDGPATTEGPNATDADAE
jgi:predicted PurR-regulated permease PerM